MSLWSGQYSWASSLPLYAPAHTRSKGWCRSNMRPVFGRLCSATCTRASSFINEWLVFRSRVNHNLIADRKSRVLFTAAELKMTEHLLHHWTEAACHHFSVDLTYEKGKRGGKNGRRCDILLNAKPLRPIILLNLSPSDMSDGLPVILAQLIITPWGGSTFSQHSRCSGTVESRSKNRSDQLPHGTLTCLSM